MIRLNIYLGISYFLGGYLGTLIAIPPSHASPIWPAAGIALAGFVVYGWRVLPGIWLGSFLIQTYAFLDASSLKTAFASLVTGAIVSTAASLQAGFGTWLIKRYAGADTALINDGGILRFFSLGGPVSCMVCASVGMFTLYVRGIINQDDVVFGWLTWWSGDTIGVLIFTPLLLCIIGKPRPLWQTRINSIALPLVILLLFVTALFYLGKYQEQKRVSTLFEERASLLGNALQNEFNRTVDINQTLKAFFDGSMEITPSAFKTFTHTVLITHKNIQALEWIPRITADNRRYYQQLLGPSFVIQVPDAKRKMQAAPPRNEYFPIAYVEPYRSNERAFGFDISSNPAAYKAIQMARDTGQTTMTKRIQLIQDANNYPAVVIYTPVYQAHQWVHTEQQRRQYLRGFVANVLLVDNKVNEIKNQFEHLQLSLKITDEDIELFNDTTGYPALNSDFPKLEKNLRLQVANRYWNITYSATPLFYTTQLSWHIWWLILGSLLLVSLIGLGLMMLTGQTMRIEGIVKLRTGELEREIAERKKIIQQRNDHNKVLQAIVSTKPLKDILDLIVNITEHTYPESLCSILLPDEDKKRLRLNTESRLPESYNQVIGSNGVGCCGSATHPGQRMIVEDIGHDSFWQGYAKQAGLASCWSEPIFSSTKQLLGTFVIYHRMPFCPNAAQIDEIKDISQLVSIAVEKKQSEERITHLAFFDALTNLPNRRLFFDRLEQVIAKAVRSFTGSALLYLDLDHFKTLNDALGHDVGDELLIQVANRLKECIRDEDTVARLGGDEFVLLLNSRGITGTLFDHALTIAERVQMMLQKPYELKGYTHHISSSIGITLLDKTAMMSQEITSGELLKQADTAMYHAKQRGRNTISFYNGDMQLRADQRLLLEQDLRNALSNEEFFLHYQPQFDDNGQLIGAEALLRWRHPEKGMISPADFIPVAEETGLILAIGEWVLRKSCKQLQQWPNLPHLAINICPKEFKQPQFEANIIAILKDDDIAASRLMLEITEGIIIDDINNSIAKLQALKNWGINISIDDFGTGYSSLSYLKKLPISQLKIDQSFVRDISIDPNDAIIVETIIAMAGHLGLSVIAEGVETAEQLQFLNDKHCKGFQGYFLSKPLPEAEFTRKYM
ncbi:MAG: EAL domain-containing protein [Methylovulum sp.]|nr:EAL domain-containing protein [Methylovulum sp.]